MFIKQAALFWGLSHEFVKSVMDHVEKASFDTGEMLFFEGEPATDFYTLIQGRIKLNVSDPGRCVFMVNHGGESFGWSALVDRDVYSASAECLAPTKVIKIDRDVFSRILNDFPADGLVFMKRLAALLGQRLVHAYEMVGHSLASVGHPSYGTGQVQETTAEE